MPETLTISLEKWLQWRQRMELLASNDGVVPLEEIASNIDELEQAFEHCDSSYTSAPPNLEILGVAPPALPKPPELVPKKTVDASTQLYTVREGHFSYHVLKSIQNRLSVRKLSHQVGVLGNLVSCLSHNLLAVMALWLSGSTDVLQPPPPESTDPGRASSPVCQTAEQLLEEPSALVQTIHRETANAIVAFLPQQAKSTLLSTSPKCSSSAPTTELLARLVSLWSSLRPSNEPTSRSWVCRMCRESPSRMYNYDSSNRRLESVISEGGKSQARHDSRSQPSGSERNAVGSPFSSPMKRLKPQGGGPIQRQLCSTTGFSRTLANLARSISPHSQQLGVSVDEDPSLLLRGKRSVRHRQLM